MSRRTLALAAALLALVGLAVAIAFSVGRPALRALLDREPPAPLTPLALTLPEGQTASGRTPQAGPTRSPVPSQPATSSPVPSAPPTQPATSSPVPSAPPPTQPATPSPLPPAPPTPVVVGARSYTVLLPAAVKNGQRFQYSCEFDAAWVIMQSYGLGVSEDELIAAMPQDTSIEPFIEEGPEGYIIRGGDILRAYSGDYRANFLARSTGSAFGQLFGAYGLESRPVRSRAELEAALLRGELVWMKTTVDFKPWRPATWITPDGTRIKTVLGNDHAVVAIGFNAEVVVIRDVLGPTSTGPDRPLEYEVRWDPFLAAWGAQDYDGLAVARP